MSATDPFVLPADVILRPVGDLASEIQARIQAKPTQFLLGRPGARTADKVIDGAAAALLQYFRRPTTIAQAVLDLAEQIDSDPEALLTEAFDFLSECAQSGILVPADSPLAQPIVATLRPGSRVANVEVLRPVQLTLDTEVYEAREPLGRGERRCLKISRLPGSPDVAARLAHEAAVLRHLEGSVSPRLCAHGLEDDRAFIVTTWHAGQTVDAIGQSADQMSLSGGPRARLRIATGIVRTFAALHECGVIHGDVHSGNVVIDANGRVVLVDFGLARLPGTGTGAPPRGGTLYFLDPQHARARAESRGATPASTVSDQYGVGVLLFLLFTGRHYLPFSVDEATVLRQIVCDDPLSFADCGASAWPDLEQVIRRALSKDPERRFASMADMAHALDHLPPTRAPRGWNGRHNARSGMVVRFLRRVGASGYGARHSPSRPPYGSVMAGGSGVALALSRIAAVRQDPLLLALAESWSLRARNTAQSAHAYYDFSDGTSAAILGRASLFHSAMGTWAVQALIDHLLGNTSGVSTAVDAFAREVDAGDAQVDVIRGRAGALLGCCHLLELPGLPDASVSTLHRTGERVARCLASHLESMPPFADPVARPALGVAHGSAGLLFALMRWCEASGSKPSTAVRDRLAELAACGVPVGRGLRWPWIDPTMSMEPPVSMPGWCNGSAGYVHTWLLAHTMFGDARFLDLAERAGWDAWMNESPAWDLCCGAAGRSYALLAVWRQTADRAWLTRARRLARRAAMDAERAPVDDRLGWRDGLMRGCAGVAMLVEDLAHPENARMPFGERDAWPASRHSASSVHE